jgi:hypothetical protein
MIQSEVLELIRATLAKVQIQLATNTAAAWVSTKVLKNGQLGHESDTKLSKIGDGVTQWSDLPYLKARGVDVLQSALYRFVTDSHLTDWFVSTATISSGTLAIDCSLGGVFNIAHNANIVTLSFSSLPTAGRNKTITLNLTQDATGGRTITWPVSVKIPIGGVTLSTTALSRNKVSLNTIDGGASWDLMLIGKY